MTQVVGQSDEDDGVVGASIAAHKSGVFGSNPTADGNGVAGVSSAGNGVYGRSDDSNGVFGMSIRGAGIYGFSPLMTGVAGTSKSGAGVVGISDDDSGVVGRSNGGQGVTALSTDSVALYASGGKFAAVMKGHVVIETGDVVVRSGDIRVETGDVILVGADCAEDFSVDPDDNARPGSVMVVDDDGLLQECRSEYDPRVVGVVSGAGGFRPAIVMDRTGNERDAHRQPIALIGKVFCQVDASFGAISSGDLLTSSPTPGHAMRAADRDRAAGAVLGKALAGLNGGRGMIPMLVALQ